MADLTPKNSDPRPFGLENPTGVRRISLFATNYVDGGNLSHTPVITSGRGVPTDTAPRGSIYIRIGNVAVAGARIYVNQDGAATWAAIAGV